ncbi:Glucose-repressible alcohol dehydrogenase transcriptional effector [Fusarium acuminatum]|uniref:Glucose-repressible alcohol dehydrogenase transcriptional effector n=1 Tax=Fusarium acuminatum TaxID=5515 RepID=A0ABZ2WL45_9HYPO
MSSEELSLPRLPAVSWDEQSQTFSNNPRKRVRNAASKHAPSSAFNNSSDPAIFSSDDDPALDNYVEGRRKKRYVGSWFQQHPTSSDSTFSEIHVPKQRRPWTRQADSGVFLGSDGNESDDMLEPVLEEPKPRLPQLDLAVRRVSRAEQVARDKVRACLEAGEETIDFWSMGLEDVSNDTISPLSQFACIPIVTKDVAFEQKDPELKIYMAQNRLARVPGAIFDLTYLTILSLRHNKLTELPPAIAKLHHLKELNVSQNRLRHLPAELLDLFASDSKLDTLVVHPNPFWQPDQKLEQTEDQSDNMLFSYTESEPSSTPHLVSRALGRTPLQLSDTTGRIFSSFKFPTDHRKLILPVDDGEPEFSPSSSVSSMTESQRLEGASHVPSLLETALRACYSSTQLSEMPYYIPEGLNHLRKLLERAQRQKEAGGLTCSRCRKLMVIPTAEWVEWREVRTCKEIKQENSSVVRMTPLSMAEGEKTVPFIHRGCSWRCGPGEIDKDNWGLPNGNLVPVVDE